MKNCCALLLILCAFWSPITSAEQVDRLIPADSVFAGAVHDIASFRRDIEDSPVYGLYEDPAIQAFLAPLIRKIEESEWKEKFEEETGYEFDEFLDFFPGGIAFYLTPDFIQTLESDQEGDFDAGSMVLLAGAGDKAGELQALITRLDEKDLEKRSADSSTIRVDREYRDVMISIEKKVPSEEEKAENDGAEEDTESEGDFAWAFVGDVLVLSGGVNLVETTIDQVLDSSRGEALIDSPDLGFLRKQLDDDAYFYVAIPPFLPLIESSFNEGLGKQNASGLTGGDFLNAFGINEIQGAVISGKLEKGKIGVQVGVGVDALKGIFKLFALKEHELSETPGIPEDALGFGVFHFDFKESWQSLKEIANTLNPMFLAMAQGRFKGWEEAKGIHLDLQGALLENLGPETLVVQYLPEEDGSTEEASEDADAPPGPSVMDQVVVFEISDRQSLQALIESTNKAAADGGELFESREFLDGKIWSLRNSGPFEVSYALDDHHFYLATGGHHALEETLIAQSRPTEEGIWSRPEVRKALASAPSRTASFGFQSSDQWMAAFLKGLVSGMSIASGGKDLMVDPEALPSPDVFSKYLGPAVTIMNRNSSGIMFATWVLSPEDDAS